WGSNMTRSNSLKSRALLFAVSALSGLTLWNHASAAQGDQPNAPAGDVIVTLAKTTRSAVLLSGSETQKLLPGISPLKAIETLPGVIFETADPWGNNEQ